jgi:hypothetical protein
VWPEKKSGTQSKPIQISEWKQLLLSKKLPLLRKHNYLQNLCIRFFVSLADNQIVSKTTHPHFGSRPACFSPFYMEGRKPATDGVPDI